MTTNVADWMASATIVDMFRRINEKPLVPARWACATAPADFSSLQAAAHHCS